MIYFDALSSSYFKIAKDGRRTFFPYGALGAGYVIPDESHYEWLHRKIRTYLIVSLTLIIGGSIATNAAAAIALAAISMAFYFFWSRRLLAGLRRSDETLSLKESMMAQARAHNGIFIWGMEIVSLVFVGTGIAILVTDPSQWAMAVPATLFFGLCAVFIGRMLILRRRAAA